MIVGWESIGAETADLLFAAWMILVAIVLLMFITEY